MTYLSPEQCRAARALLDWQQLDLAKQSKVSQKSIADFERGRTTPWARTLDDLREAFEAAGVDFLDDVEGVGGVGVRMRAGFKAVTRTATGEGRSAQEKGGIDAIGWEGDFEEADSGGDNPMSDEDSASLRRYYQDHPERWARLSDAGKACLARAMRL